MVGGGAPRAAAHVAQRRSTHAWLERWPERLWHRDVGVLAAAAWAGVGASVAGVVGIEPGPVVRHG
jgi:hypothetical protein